MEPRWICGASASRFTTPPPAASLSDRSKGRAGTKKSCKSEKHYRRRRIKRDNMNMTELCVSAGIKSSQRSRRGRFPAIRSVRTGRSSGARRCRFPAVCPSKTTLRGHVSAPSFCLGSALWEKSHTRGLVFQGSSEPADPSPRQYPGGRSGEVLGLRPVLRRDQRHPAPDCRLRVQPATGHAAPCLHPRVQHVRQEVPSCCYSIRELHPKTSHHPHNFILEIFRFYSPNILNKFL